MDKGDTAYVINTTPNSVVVIETVIDYKCYGKYHCHEPHKFMVKDGDVFHPSLTAPEKDVFPTEQAAINEALKRRPTGGKGNRGN